MSSTVVILSPKFDKLLRLQTLIVATRLLSYEYDELSDVSVVVCLGAFQL